MTGRWLLGARLLFAVAVLATAWTSLLPPEDLPSSLGLSDKLIHGVGYAVLAMLAVASGLRWPIALAAVIGLGLALEIAQGLLGYRSFEWADLLADALGAAVGVVVGERILAPVRRRQAAVAQERKRQWRRDRDAEREQRRVERAMSPAKAAARKGAPKWQQVAERQGAKCWLCGRRTHDDDRQRQADGSYRLGATFPTVVYVTRLDQGGTYELDNCRIAHRHCAALRDANPARRDYGTPKRTFA